MTPGQKRTRIRVAVPTLHAVNSATMGSRGWLQPSLMRLLHTSHDILIPQAVRPFFWPETTEPPSYFSGFGQPLFSPKKTS